MIEGVPSLLEYMRVGLDRFDPGTVVHTMSSEGAEHEGTRLAIARRVRQVRQRIGEACARADRRPEEVTLIAVTKTRPLDDVKAVLAAGVQDIGENYVQPAMERVEAMGRERCRWHLIGHLQTNKARHAVAFVDWLHTIDSVAIANEVGRRALSQGRSVNCLVEVNVSGEGSKYGVAPEELEPLYEHAAQVRGLAVNGLMTVAPFTEDPEDVRGVFAQLREFRVRLRDAGYPAEHLSMGMTGDFEVAIEEGSTMVRIGTALFGPRDR